MSCWDLQPAVIDIARRQVVPGLGNRMVPSSAGATDNLVMNYLAVRRVLRLSFQEKKLQVMP